MIISELIQRLQQLSKKAQLAIEAQDVDAYRLQLRPALVPQGVQLAAQPVWEDDGGR
jgi:hypothetical protein